MRDPLLRRPLLRRLLLRRLLRRPRCGRRAPDRGYSFSEALVVIGILGVVASTGVIAIRHRDHRTAVAGLAQEIFLRAAAARTTAVATGTQVLLGLDPTDSNADGQVATLQLATRTGMSTAGLTFAPAGDAVTGRRDARISGLSGGTALSGAAVAGPNVSDGIVFFPDGSARLRSTNTLGATIYLTDAVGNSPHRVTIFGRTGFAKLLDH